MDKSKRKFSIVLEEAEQAMLLKLKHEYEKRLDTTLTVAELVRIVLRDRYHASKSC